MPPPPYINTLPIKFISFLKNLFFHLIFYLNFFYFSNIIILIIIIYIMMNTIDIDTHMTHIYTHGTHIYNLTYDILYDRLYIERNNRMNNNNLTDKDMINMIEGIIRNISEPNAKGYVYTPSVAVDLIYSMIQHCKESGLYKR